MQRVATLVLLSTYLASAVYAVDIKGRLVYGDGGTVGAAEIRAYSRGPEVNGKRQSRPLFARVRSNGEFVLKDAFRTPSEDSPIPLAVRLDGGRFAIARLSREGGEAIVSSRTVSVTLRLRDSKGRPVKGAGVHVMSVSDGASREADFAGEWGTASRLVETYSNYLGIAELKELPPGATIRVAVRPDGRVYNSVTVKLPSEGGVHAEDVVVKVGIVLAGRVTRNGQPLHGVALSYMSQNGRYGTGSETTTDKDGNYRFVGVPVGKVMVCLKGSRFETEWVAPKYDGIDALDGEARLDLDFKLEKGLPLTLKLVSDADGKPLGKVRVRLGLGLEGEYFTTNAEGTFTTWVFPDSIRLLLDQIDGKRLQDRYRTEIKISKDAPSFHVIRVPAAFLRTRT